MLPEKSILIQMCLDKATWVENHFSHHGENPALKQKRIACLLQILLSCCEFHQLTPDELNQRPFSETDIRDLRQFCFEEASRIFILANREKAGYNQQIVPLLSKQMFDKYRLAGLNALDLKMISMPNAPN